MLNLPLKDLYDSILRTVITNCVFLGELHQLSISSVRVDVQIR
jgi:hypothetical protein